jgi:hypothetical protein
VAKGGGDHAGGTGDRMTPHRCDSRCKNGRGPPRLLFEI